ncbi:uncharacterized protein JN550_000483 [Neoarthrinium moseri]|uniref:uncharacterized protein n=1 Tax=Neoarthrinium moseri TaxID=1658444 RepID=UPI001FDBD47C|nr:uncharacterized protein JN550_000483 [Neoarthrinium moseri]KAI1878301.1 hypothetical protein JN550_000483 [Neoarthrinium moseri]
MSIQQVPEIVVSTFNRGLDTFAHILSKAEQHAKENDIDVNSLVDARVVEDQLPLSFQVQFTSRVVRTNLGRLSGEVLPPWDENEKTFEDLKKRVERTQELVKSFDLAKTQGKEGEKFEMHFKGQDHTIYLMDFMLTHVLPNFFFHISTAYSILRAKGVPLGKEDWLGGFLGL